METRSTLTEVIEILSKLLNDTDTEYSYKNFIDGKYGVNCLTEHDADLLLMYLHVRGVKWFDNDSLLDEEYKQVCENKTYYRHVTDEGLYYGNIDWPCVDIMKVFNQDLLAQWIKENV